HERHVVRDAAAAYLSDSRGGRERTATRHRMVAAADLNRRKGRGSPFSLRAVADNDTSGDLVPAPPQRFDGGFRHGRRGFAKGVDPNAPVRGNAQRVDAALGDTTG